MSRFINADVFEVFGYTSQDGTFDDGVQFVLEKIDEQPTADVVEVVRCKDCVYWEQATSGRGNCNRAFEITAYASDYCSYGERREEK